jgi:hypothetical protein
MSHHLDTMSKLITMRNWLSLSKPIFLSEQSQYNPIFDIDPAGKAAHKDTDHVALSAAFPLLVQELLTMVIHLTIVIPSTMVIP